MHNYVSLNDPINFSFNIQQEHPNNSKGASKLKDGEMNIESLQRQRDQDLANLGFSKMPNMQSNPQSSTQQFRR